MPWIESHQKLERHPKLSDLCNQTGWSVSETIGKLHQLWWWALDYAEDGDLSRYNPHQFLGHIKGGLKDNLTEENLYLILQNTNFIEKSGLIHDWLDYAGRYLHAKYHSSNPKKWKEIRKKHRVYLKSTFSRPLGPNNLPNLPNLTYNNVVASFPLDIQSLTKEYIELAEKENKTGKILETKKLRLITELYNLYIQSDPAKFKQALEITIKNQAPNINYVKKVYKNTEKKKAVVQQNKASKEKEEFEQGSQKGKEAYARTKDYIDNIKSGKTD